MRALAAGAATLVALLVAPAAGAQTAQGSKPAGQGFCAAPGPRDYAEPLGRLPKIRRIPASGQLPFGPAKLNFYSTAFEPVIVGGGDYGYALFDEDFNRDLRLDWTVKGQLLRLGKSGDPVRELDHGQIEVGLVDDAYQPSLDLEVPARAGFYRFDVEFLGADGMLLGRFGEYLRVVRPWAKARLAINGRRFTAGQVVRTRIENVGTEQVNSGAPFEVQRRIDGAWREVHGLTPEVWPLYASIIGPGSAGECGGFGIPPDLPAGRYRVVKPAGAVYGDDARDLHLSAWFDVV
ncbi:MAG: immunoglobulin-like domain-containing protein [Solirubrobacterales bacterium]